MVLKLPSPAFSSIVANSDLFIRRMLLSVAWFFASFVKSFAVEITHAIFE